MSARNAARPIGLLHINFVRRPLKRSTFLGRVGIVPHKRRSAYKYRLTVCRRLVHWPETAVDKERGGGVLCQLAERASCKLHSWHATVEPQNLKCRPMRPNLLTHDPAARNAGYMRQRER
jgi:hypothetical protein